MEDGAFFPCILFFIFFCLSLLAHQRIACPLILQLLYDQGFFYVFFLFHVRDG